MSRILALLSLVFFAGSLLTAVRFRFLSRLFGSLVHRFRVHHWLGLCTGLAFLMHVLWELWQTPADFVLSMILTTDTPLLAGWMAFLAFAVALLFSYRRKPSLSHLASLAFSVSSGVHSSCLSCADLRT